jgi:chemotaxis protein MotB
MQAFKTAILATSLAALAGCANWDKSPICNPSHGWTAWSDTRCNAPKDLADNASKDAADRFAALEKERQRLADELAAAQKQNGALSSRMSDLERQLAASTALAAGLQAGAGDKGKLAAELAAAKQRNAELESQLAGLRGELSSETTKLNEAQRGLIRALRPQIEKGNITVDLNNERLLINLASGYLFRSGEDQLKPAGADTLKQVGAILKDFPEYKVHVEGHTDNRPIQGALKKKFPSNKELSESRAANAARAMTEGGLGTATTHGYGDTKPVEPNTTDAGRAKNRRVEVRVTK